ncbi:MAG: hypothetical protein FJZ58_07740 [Chlamydiae bacterium]|nr:hypothetical protein [Chlamydiota bacterium]
MNILCITFLSLLSLITAYADVPQHTLSSNQASYQGDLLILEGDFRMEHSLGLLCASKAYLQKSLGSTEIPFSYIHLQDHVEFLLHTKEKLLCAQAECNFLSGEAILRAHSEDVVRCELSFLDAEHKQYPMTLSCPLLYCYFHIDHPNEPLDHLRATKGVHIEYMEQFTLQAEEAIYERHPGTSDLFSAYAVQQDHPCILTYQGETISTPKVTIAVHKKQLHVEHPKGTLLTSLLASKQMGKTSFSCHDLFWNQDHRSLCLQGDVDLQENMLGHIHTTKELILVQQGDHIDALHIEGEALLEHDSSQLHSPSSLHIEKGRGVAQGDQDLPVLYTDERISLSAKSMTMQYEESSYAIAELSLQQEVQMHILNAKHSACYGLADEATYSPLTKTLILKSTQGKKVLFWDQEQNIAISAREVHVKHDPSSGKTGFYGIGDTKCTFSPEEALSLKTIFPSIFYPKGP